MTKSIKVNIVDDSGALITSGPNANIFIKLLQLSYQQVSASPSAQYQLVYAQIGADNQDVMWARTSFMLTHNATNQELSYTGGQTVSADFGVFVLEVSDFEFPANFNDFPVTHPHPPRSKLSMGLLCSTRSLGCCPLSILRIRQAAPHTPPAKV